MSITARAANPRHRRPARYRLAISLAAVLFLVLVASSALSYLSLDRIPGRGALLGLPAVALVAGATWVGLGAFEHNPADRRRHRLWAATLFALALLLWLLLLACLPLHPGGRPGGGGPLGAGLPAHDRLRPLGGAPPRPGGEGALAAGAGGNRMGRRRRDLPRHLGGGALPVLVRPRPPPRAGAGRVQRLFGGPLRRAGEGGGRPPPLPRHARRVPRRSSTGSSTALRWGSASTSWSRSAT